MSVLWFCWGTSERTATRWHVVERREEKRAKALCSIGHYGDDLVFQSYVGSSEPKCRSCVKRLADRIAGTIDVPPPPTDAELADLPVLDMDAFRARHADDTASGSAKPT